MSLKRKKLSLFLAAIKFSLPLLLSAAVCFAAASWSLPALCGRPTVSIFDVGQGDSILVQDGWTQMLVDGGPDRLVLSRLGRAMPFGDRHIEYVLLTHPHDDHVFGLFSVLERYEVGTVIVTDTVGDAEIGENFLELVRKSGVRVVTVHAGDQFMIGKRVRASALWPSSSAGEGDDGDASTRMNNSSAVVRVDALAGTEWRPFALLTGDIGSAVESSLVGSASPLAAPVVKIPHHGSRYSSTPEFVSAVRPEFAVVSVGVNRYGHPSETIMRRWSAAGASAYRTDRDGDEWFVFDGTVSRGWRL